MLRPDDAFAFPVELQALLLERLETWSRVIVQAHLGSGQIMLPHPVQIQRPGEPREPERKRPNPHRIREWFQRLGGRR